MEFTPSSADDLYPMLLAAHHAAFAAGHYETAYHALMAALHSAQDRHDIHRLDAIAELAAAQQQRIDTNEPEHRLSSATAAARGHSAMLTLASHQAHAQATLARRRAGES
jgi:hypothetical protein